ncbi:MAG TPA: hypothetical protein DDZ67_05075 [Xanthomonadaceae bacterium]|nr:hypothetical protein [Xanthomonadaceae bacterium]
MIPLDPIQIYRARGCSRQWQGFVRAMAAEFAAELPPRELATLMARIGQRFAREHPLRGCASLAEVEGEANRVWSDSDWGGCRMVERADCVEILHAAAPISVVLEGAEWGDGFLEGVYEGWFQQLGMLAGLAVMAGEPRSGDLRCFRLARRA